MSTERYRVLYSTVARADLKAVYRYIAFNLHAKIAAKAQTDRIREEVKSLATFPERYERISWNPWCQMGIRRVPVDNFIVYYRVDHDEKLVEIARIFYGGRDVENIINTTETFSDDTE